MVTPRQTGIVIIRDKVLKEMLSIDVMRQLKANVKGRGIDGEKASKTEDEFGKKVKKRELLRGMSI